MIISTVDVVIFSLGEISRNCWQDISRGGKFHDTTPIWFLKAYGVFSHGGNFREEDKSMKMQKLLPR